MPKQDKKIIEVFTKEQLQALEAACDKEYMPALVRRDKAILAVLQDTGIRASELCDLTLDHVYLRPDESYIKVMGKGWKEREVGLSKKSSTALHRDITRYRQADRKETHVFLSRFDKPLTMGGLELMITRLGKWVCITGVCCSPHMFRHTFAVQYLHNGGDVYRLARLMGHEEVRTTEVYLRAMKGIDVRRKSLSVLDAM